MITDFGDAESEIAKTIRWYNDERRHSSLQYLTPVQYYRGNPGELLSIREGKMERARMLRKERFEIAYSMKHVPELLQSMDMHFGKPYQHDYRRPKDAGD